MKTAIRNIDNELIRKRRKKRAIRRTIISLVLLISILSILCLKLPYFNVSNVKVLNNNIISAEEILNLSKVNKGTNIFYMNLKNIETNVMKNPYILSVEVRRKIPNTITISVKEREAAFYINSGSINLIVDKHGVVLEEKEDISNMNLINLQGVELQDVKIGKVIPFDDKRKINVISLITDLIAINTSNINISSVNIKDVLDIRVYSESLCIKLGDTSNIKDKLNLALNIINDNKLNKAKGYIDVSFQAKPVVHIDK